jgi:hypothetical protein
MMTTETAFNIWTSAYNAALTGLISRETRVDPAFNVESLTVDAMAKQCVVYADRALKDAEARLG